MIEYVITVGLVHSIEQAASDLGKYAKLHIFILKKQSLICTVLLLTLHVLVHDIHIVIEDIRIYAAASTLV